MTKGECTNAKGKNTQLCTVQKYNIYLNKRGLGAVVTTILAVDTV